jgi:uncharacterized Zn-binding protein involved in type VI secretion
VVTVLLGRLTKGGLMGKPAAKKGDKVVGVDIHIVMVPAPSGQIPTPMPMAFSGKINGKLSKDVLIQRKPAAVKGSTADNSPKHIATGGTFQKSPTNQGKISSGSSKVLINGKQAAHTGDPVETCNDPSDSDKGKVIGSGTVLVGD